jgi:GT2 family glycosyltransferase
MNNVFAMVTLHSSNFYTGYALQSFFKYTEIDDDDEFLLIDNDKSEIEKFLIYKKINIIKNSLPLSFGENVNQAITIAKKNKKNLVFLNNDIIFTKNWFEPIKSESENISIPTSNLLFNYSSDCGNLILKPTMQFSEFNENYNLLNNIISKHIKRFESQKKFQTLLMPFFCFKIPYKILEAVGYFDESFITGGEDVDYRIRSAKKGYDVNFLLNTFLLHFHGKSTWDGNESPQQTEKRNSAYTEAFLKKWGKELTQIFIIRKDFDKILIERGLIDLFKQGRFGELIRKII